MEKTPKDAIGLFKLISGEEIVAEYVAEDSNTFTLKKVRAILLGRDAKGALSLQLGPWILSEQDAEYTINKAHLLTYNLDISPQLISAYISNTTGLTVATNASKLIA
jgi:hypothetical protein